MTAHVQRTRSRVLSGLVLIASVACTNASPTSPGAQSADVGGTWDARITATQQRSGAAQTDDVRLTLRQNATEVTGVITYSGLSTPASLSGSVANRTFTFTATLLLSPACQATAEATLSVSAEGNEMRGSYRAVTCEDTVIGILTATRR